MRNAGIQLRSRCTPAQAKGCNMVLGVDWLKSVSPVTFDFNILTLEFSYQKIKLSGTSACASLGVIGTEYAAEYSN